MIESSAPPGEERTIPPALPVTVPDPARLAPPRMERTGGCSGSSAVRLGPR